MLQLIKKVVAINVIVAVIVWILSNYIDYFAATRLSDFLFLMVIVLWILAKLMWEGGVQSKTVRYDNPKLDSVYKMVKGHDFEQEERKNHRQNYHDGLVLFIAAIPALIACIVLQYF